MTDRPSEVSPTQEEQIPDLSREHRPHLYMLTELLDCDDCIEWLYAHAERLKRSRPGRLSDE